MDMWTNEHAENIFLEATEHKQNVRLSQKKINQNTSITATLNKAAATSRTSQICQRSLAIFGSRATLLFYLRGTEASSTYIEKVRGEIK